VEIDPSIFVRTDRGLFARVVRNLVHNAVKYTARGSVCLLARRHDAALVLAIADTGRGIPRELHQRIFEPYFRVDGASTNREDGIGLGLDIVRRFSETLGLTLSLESSPQGSTFFIRIPPERVVLLPPATSEVAHAHPQAALPRPLHVLLVDDDAATRDALQRRLELLGCRVDSAACAADALAATRVRRPDLVVTDYHLGDDETGIEVVEALRAACGGVPALIVTGDRSPEVRAAARSADMPLIDKSADLAALAAAMGAITGQALARSVP